ncbi:MAG: hypothetical protein ABDH37_01610 [Candidatus Hydrothermales bacterium]
MFEILFITQILQPYFNPEFGGVLYSKFQKDLDTNHIISEFSFEFVMKGAIDPYFIFYGIFPITEKGIELEEAYSKTLTLPFEILIGKFKSRFTRLNTFHPHFYDFPELPQMYEYLTFDHKNHSHFHEVENHKDKGVNGIGIGISYIFPFKIFIEPGIEIFKDKENNFYNYLSYLHFSNEIPFSTTLWMSTYMGLKKDTVKWVGIEIVLKRIKPGEERLKGLLITGGYFQDAKRHFNSFYFDFVYKFMPRWRLGYRFDLLEEENKSIRKNIIMIDFSPTEFSRFRLSYEVKEKKIFFETNFSVGPHGAHPF